jgi:hypothetical protein
MQMAGKRIKLADKAVFTLFKASPPRGKVGEAIVLKQIGVHCNFIQISVMALEVTTRIK